MTDLEVMAMYWLRLHHGCPAVLFERSPRYGNGEPDVLGITKHRYLLEIEVKRSLSDFKANMSKRHIQYRLPRIQAGEDEKWPKRFWFLVPYSLVGDVREILPSWAGLLRGPNPEELYPRVHTVVEAPVNKASLRLSALECGRLMQVMANQIYSQSLRLCRDGCWEGDYSI